MDVAILETGRPPEPLRDRFGRYDAMVRDLLGPDHAFRTFTVFDGEWPEDPAAFDTYVVTGSAAGVNDGLAWVDELVAFLRALPRDTKLVGLCFGHQVMAHAFGGVVRKAEAGWGLGLGEYRVCGAAPWLDGAERVAVPAIHQDQVVGKPPGARVIAGSEFTPLAILAYDDRRAISFQCHPEFSRDFLRALVEGGAAPDAGDAVRADALRSLDGADDTARLGRWIDGFLRGG